MKSRLLIEDILRAVLMVLLVIVFYVLGFLFAFKNL